MKHCYLGIENINLNANQKKAFMQTLKELGSFGGIYSEIRQSSLDATQKELILTELYKHGKPLDVARLINRIDKQQADFEDEEINGSEPDMTPLTNAEKKGLKKLFEKYEPKGSPAKINHWRVRPDGNAIILEAEFKDESITVDAIKKFLGNVFGIDWNTIDHKISNTIFDTLETPIVTYSRAGMDYIRFALFGGKDASWEESGQEARAYIKDWDESE